MPKIISKEIREKVKELYPDHSTASIAKITGITQRSVFRILNEWNLNRTQRDNYLIRSTVRKRIVNAERRRIIFGEDQKTGLKVYSNNARHSLMYRLKRVGYIPGNERYSFFFNEKTRRNEEYEKMGMKLGITFTPQT